MVGSIIAVVGVLVLGVGVLAGGFVLGMRRKSPPVTGPIVAFASAG